MSIIGYKDMTKPLTGGRIYRCDFCTNTGEATLEQMRPAGWTRWSKGNQPKVLDVCPKCRAMGN